MRGPDAPGGWPRRGCARGLPRGLGVDSPQPRGLRQGLSSNCAPELRAGAHGARPDGFVQGGVGALLGVCRRHGSGGRELHQPAEGSAGSTRLRVCSGNVWLGRLSWARCSGRNSPGGFLMRIGFLLHFCLPQEGVACLPWSLPLLRGDPTLPIGSARTGFCPGSLPPAWETAPRRGPKTGAGRCPFVKQGR